MKRFAYNSLLGLFALCTAATVSFAQSWMPGIGSVYTSPVDTRVGIGTSAPICRLQIESSNGLWPLAHQRFVQRLLPQATEDTTAFDCYSAGHLGLAHREYDLSTFARRGDIVLNITTDEQNVCGRDVVIDAQTNRGSVRFGTGSNEPNNAIPGGFRSWQRMVLDAPAGNTRLELQAIEQEGEHKNAMLRFSRANGWSRLGLGDIWAIGMDDNNNLIPEYLNAGKSVFKIGKSHYSESTQFNSSYLTVLGDGRVLIGRPLSVTGGTGIIAGRDLKDSKLQVDGTVLASEYLCIASSNWADFVFEEDYKLMPLHELEESIKKNKHLPDIPSAAEVASNGVSLNEMQVKLLQKVEELTLYVIEQDKKIKSLEAQLETGK